MSQVSLFTLRRNIVLGWLAIGAATALWLPLRVDDPRYGWSLAWWLLGAPLLMLGVTAWRGGVGGPRPALRQIRAGRTLAHRSARHVRAGRALARRGGDELAWGRIPFEVNERERVGVHGQAVK